MHYHKEKKIMSKTKSKTVEYIVAIKKASLVQLVEHRSPKPGVEGSSPSRRVKLFSTKAHCGIYFNQYI